MNTSNYYRDIADQQILRIRQEKQQKRVELEASIKPFKEKERYSRYSKTRIGNYLALQYRESGNWMIFDLNGVPMCTCEDGELDATLNELDSAS